MTILYIYSHSAMLTPLKTSLVFFPYCIVTTVTQAHTVYKLNFRIRGLPKLKAVINLGTIF